MMYVIKFGPQPLTFVLQSGFFPLLRGPLRGLGRGSVPGGRGQRLGALAAGWLVLHADFFVFSTGFHLKHGVFSIFS